MREWIKRAVLKTADAKASVGSNPTFSSIKFMKTLITFLFALPLMAQPFSKCIYCHGEFSDAKVVAAKRAKITEYILMDKMPPGDILSTSQKKNLLAEINRISGQTKQKPKQKRKKK